MFSGNHVAFLVCGFDFMQAPKARSLTKRHGLLFNPRPFLASSNAWTALYCASALDILQTFHHRFVVKLMNLAACCLVVWLILSNSYCSFSPLFSFQLFDLIVGCPFTAILYCAFAEVKALPPGSSFASTWTQNGQGVSFFTKSPLLQIF
jgi:hypothetical protein